MIDFMTNIHNQLGIMTWPLTFLSILMMMLIIERLIFCLLHSRNKSRQLTQEIYALSLTDENALNQFIERHQNQKNTLSSGLCMLIKHRSFTKALREESVSIWLQARRRQYVSGLKLLNIIGVLTPLLGLLGTVIGLIDMFKGLSNNQTGVSPAALADGLGLAMSTTAAGLFIAVPAIAFAQIFHLWAERQMAKIEFILNHFNLHLSGISVTNTPQCCVKLCPKKESHEIGLHPEEIQ